MSKYPPLWVWAVVLGLSLAMLCYINHSSPTGISILSSSQYQTFLHQLDNSLPAYQADSSACRVVCLGSSLTCQAVAHGSVLRQGLAAEGIDAAVQKIYVLSATSQKIPNVQEVFTSTASLKPQLILLEDHLFSHYTYEDQTTQLEKKIKLFLEQLPVTKTKTAKISRSFLGKTFDHRNKRLDNEPPLTDTLSIRQKRRRITSFAETSHLREQLAFVHEQNIPLVILNIPRVGVVEEMMITPEKQAQIDQLIENFRQAGFQIEYWKFPRYLPFIHYSDFAHMNTTGRDVYSAWLVQRLTQKLSDQCHY